MINYQLNTKRFGGLIGKGCYVWDTI